MRFGRVVLDEVPMEITGIELRSGQVFVTAATSGVKARLDPDAELTMFAPDGTVVLHRPSRTQGKVIKVNYCDTVDLTWRWHLVAMPDDPTMGCR